VTEANVSLTLSMRPVIITLSVYGYPA